MEAQSDWDLKPQYMLTQLLGVGRPKKKEKNIRPLGLFRGLFPDTEWLPTTLSHSCGWMEHIPSSETMCVKGLSKI